MTKRRKIILGLVLVLLGLFLLYEFRWKEPSYGGRSLSEWLVEAENTPLEKRPAIVAAVRQMGKRSLPYAFAMLRATDSQFREQVAHFMNENTIFKVEPPVPSEKLRGRGLLVLVALRNQHREIITRRLAQELEDGRSDPEILQALALMGTNGLPFLVRALTNQNPALRGNAAHALCLPHGLSYATNRIALCDALGLTVDELKSTTNAYSAAAVPSLLLCLSDSDPGCRYAAATALDGMGERPTNSVPIFISGLSGQFADKSDSARRLGHFGKAAADAVPYLVRLLNDPDERVKSAARRSLNQIDPTVLNQDPSDR